MRSYDNDDVLQSWRGFIIMLSYDHDEVLNPWVVLQSYEETFQILGGLTSMRFYFHEDVL